MPSIAQISDDKSIQGRSAFSGLPFFYSFHLSIIIEPIFLFNEHTSLYTRNNTRKGGNTMTTKQVIKETAYVCDDCPYSEDVDLCLATMRCRILEEEKEDVTIQGR